MELKRKLTEKYVHKKLDKQATAFGINLHYQIAIHKDGSVKGIIFPSDFGPGVAWLHEDETIYLWNGVDLMKDIVLNNLVEAVIKLNIIFLEDKLMRHKENRHKHKELENRKKSQQKTAQLIEND